MISQPICPAFQGLLLCTLCCDGPAVKPHRCLICFQECLFPLVLVVAPAGIVQDLLVKLLLPYLPYIGLYTLAGAMAPLAYDGIDLDECRGGPASPLHAGAWILISRKFTQAMGHALLAIRKGLSSLSICVCRGSTPDVRQQCNF